MNNPLRLRQLAISELISNYFSPLRYHRRKKNLFFFQFPENLTSIKKLIIHQLLKISFWYLFYFRSYKAKNNLKVEQKARDLWHFMSTSSRHLINVLYTEFRNRSFVIKSTYSSSFRKLERLVFASQVLFSSCYVQKQQVPFPVPKKRKIYSQVCIEAEILFKDSDGGFY